MRILLTWVNMDIQLPRLQEFTNKKEGIRNLKNRTVGNTVAAEDHLVDIYFQIYSWKEISPSEHPVDT